MAKTIILKLKGLTQFWPPKEAQNSKTTCQMPTKRGVLRHIVAAAQGRSSDADISDLEKAILFGAAVCRIGEIVNWINSDYFVNGAEKEVLESYIFYVALTCDDQFADVLAAQLQNPQGELSLGDPCVDCTPDVPVFQSITDAPMVKALLEAVNADPTRHIHMEVEIEDSVSVEHLPLRSVKRTIE